MRGRCGAGFGPALPPVGEAVRERERERVLADPLGASQPERSSDPEAISETILSSRHEPEVIVRDSGGSDPEIRARHPVAYADLRVSSRDERHAFEETRLEVGPLSKPDMTAHGLVEALVLIRKRTIRFDPAASNRNAGPLQGGVGVHILEVWTVGVSSEVGTQRSSAHAEPDRRGELVAHIGADVVVVDLVRADHAVVASARYIGVGP